jgi:hypothetical protein
MVETRNFLTVNGTLPVTLRGYRESSPTSEAAHEQGALAVRRQARPCGACAVNLIHPLSVLCPVCRE